MNQTDIHEVDVPEKSETELMQEKIAEQLATAKQEYQEISMLHEQSELEVNKLTQRNATATANLQKTQSQFERIPREEIRTAYDSAIDAQQRLFVLRGQVEKLRSDKDHLQKEIELLEMLDTILTKEPVSIKDPKSASATVELLELLVQAQEAERLRLSRQMHDGPAQALSNLILETEIAMRLFDVNKEKAYQELGTLRESASKTFQQVRDFIFELRPMMLTDLGLVPTLKRYLDAFSDKTNIETEFVMLGRERRLESYREVLVFRGIQELMANARDHGGATSIKVSIEIDDEETRAVVEDNGRGFGTGQLSLDSGEGNFGLRTLQERLALVDALPDLPGKHPGFAKLGLIPAMGCPQTCRHCMFIWRPLIKDPPDPGPLYSMVNGLTDSVLFTGGDLTRHLHYFDRAIRSMRNISTFAILLNGDFASDKQTTDQVLQSMARAIKDRPGYWTSARILLQISFDEFHQEVMVDKKGRLKERIPVGKIANIVETAPKYGKQIQLCLLHKQHALNFSMELFSKGVFGRLAEELGRRGHQLQILSTGGSRRLKQNPLSPAGAPAAILKDASFILTRHPDHPVMLTSSSIDAYGRAELLDEGESVKDRELLQRILQTGNTEGESFDTDLMFWFNGWATLFSAVHMCLGNVYEDDLDTILQRQRKDPLSKALRYFDRRLLDYYAEVRTDLLQLIGKSTGPHHLFHQLTEDSEVRLHMTQRLIKDMAVS